MSTPPPLTDHVNAYDERHLATYLRLLDAAEEGVDWREVVVVIFGIDSEREPERAKISMKAIWPERDGCPQPAISFWARACNSLSSRLP